MTNQRFRVFILGAGFSAPAGYPSARELWTEVRTRAGRLRGRAERFEADIDNFIEYKRRCLDSDVDRDDLDLEEFCGFLDIEHFLDLRGPNTWSVDGNESTIVVKTLIGQILSELTPDRAEDVPELYREFARRLLPNDIVLTFNYDTLLERSLEAVSNPYRLFPTRHNSMGRNAVESRAQEVVVLKLHGSIDWFDRAGYADLERAHREMALTRRPSHPVFGPEGDDLHRTRVIDDPHFADGGLADMFRVRDVRKLYKRRWMFLAAPWLLAPSTMKIVYAKTILDFWSGMGGLGTFNSGLAIIGYSLPQQDAYALQAIYGITKNYQNHDWGEPIVGNVKSPMVLVDLRQSEADQASFKDRYRFVDWDRATTYFNGFNAGSLDPIFFGDGPSPDNPAE